MSQEHNLVDIAVDQLDPNAYNPNRMTDEEFEELVAEVRRLGSLPKPILVRPASEGRYEISDGEHNWRAAQRVGLATVLCEIRQMDDFEARRQTFKRNQHGHHDMVLQARMFSDMKTAKNLSNRQLAQEMGISDGTVRNSLAYVEAAERRAAHTGKNSDGEIAKLPLSKVQSYLKMPTPIGDRWLDAGAHDALLQRPFTAEGPTLNMLLADVARAGLADLVEGIFLNFQGSLNRVIAYAGWLDEHFLIDGIEPYIRAAAELQLPVQVLDLLPCRYDGPRGEVILPLDVWRDLLRDCAERDVDRNDLLANVRAGVEVALHKAGVDLGEYLGPKVALVLQQLEQAPEFIRTATHLSVDEQFQLYQASADASPELVLQAKQETVELLRRRRSGDDLSPREAELADGRIEDVFQRCLQCLVQQQQASEEDEIFVGEDLAETAVWKLAEYGVLEGMVVDGRPALEVLVEQITQSRALLEFTASLLTRPTDIETATRRWLRAMEGGRTAAETEFVKDTEVSV
jgi:ParB/RepB/Spo0J family partition protein